MMRATLLAASLALVTLSGCQKGASPGLTETQLLQKWNAPDGRFKRAPLNDAQTQEFGAYFLAKKEGQAATVPAPLAKAPGLIYVAFRDQGGLLFDGWGTGPGLHEAVADVLAQAQAKLGDRWASANEFEIDLPYNFRELHPNKNRGRINNRKKGLMGVELLSPDKIMRIAPTTVVAKNITVRERLETEAKAGGTDLDGLASSPYLLRSFNADQVFVQMGPPVAIHRMIRGNTIVRDKAVTQDSVQALAEALAGWMFTNLDNSTGRLTYIYYADKEQEPDPRAMNNMIRQWMGTICITRWAKYKNDADLLAKSRKNIGYNLSQFYKERDGHGYIEFKNISKLGAISLAGLALVEHPQADDEQAKLDALVRSTYKLQDPETGRFQTYFKPDRDGGGNLHNFYPGETLLLWAFLHAKKPDPALAARFKKSFEHYKDWHLENRRPAFVPWHAQADYSMWEQTKDATFKEALKDFIFVTNDWLIDIMQDPEYTRAGRDGLPDHLGRFYSSAKSKFGPPHSASTGVYLEGLIDAFRLARAVGDEQHEEKYRRAIVRGLRSTMQLAFLDDVDMFYVKDRDRLRGGVRSRVDRNDVRVDNVQHNLMGIIKILQHFKPEDFRP